MYISTHVSLKLPTGYLVLHHIPHIVYVHNNNAKHNPPGPASPEVDNGADISDMCYRAGYFTFGQVLLFDIFTSSYIYKPPLIFTFISRSKMSMKN